MEIDLVYLWADSNDEAWLERRRAFNGVRDGNSEANCKARWIQNDELHYSLRSVEKYAPWIRHIFIVTDGQTPRWLDTSNPRVTIVNQNDIIPPEAQPCFNSAVIEYFIHRIPGLAEHFLYANDDMFFSATVQPDFFFAPDGYPIVRLNPKPFGKLRLWWKRRRGIDIGHYRRSIHRAALEVERVTGKYCAGLPHHGIDAYLRSDNQRVAEEVLAGSVAAMLPHHVRTEGDIQRVALSYWPLAKGRAHLRKITDHSESAYLMVSKSDWREMLDIHSPSLFCLNDSEHANDDDRARIRPFLEALFPERSALEVD